MNHPLRAEDAVPLTRTPVPDEPIWSPHPQLRSELALSDVAEFRVRWRRLGNVDVGPFRSLDELIGYMADHRLPRPDELVVPLDLEEVGRGSGTSDAGG